MKLLRLPQRIQNRRAPISRLEKKRDFLTPLGQGDGSRLRVTMQLCNNLSIRKHMPSVEATCQVKMQCLNSDHPILQSIGMGIGRIGGTFRLRFSKGYKLYEVRIDRRMRLGG